MTPKIYSFDDSWRGATVVVAFDLESATKKIQNERADSSIKETDIVCHEIRIGPNCKTQLIVSNLGDS